MKPFNRIFFNTGILYFKLFISLIVGLFTTRLILGALGQTDYGIYTVVAGVIGMLSFLQAAMSQSSVRFIAHSQGSGDIKFMNRVYNSTIFIHYILGFIVIILLEILGFIMFKFWLEIPIDRVYSAKIVYQFMILTTFVTIISVPFDAVISAKENFLALSLIDILGVILKLFIAIYITYIDDNVLIFFGVFMFIQQFIVRILKQWYSRFKYKEYKVSMKSNLDRKLIKEILSFSGWNLISSGGIIVSLQMRSILLNMFFGVRINAADGVAKSLSSTIMTFVTSMSNAFSPQIQKNEGAGDRNKMLDLTYIIARLSIIVTGVISIPVIIEMPLLLDLWLKEVPEFAVIFGRLLIINILIRRFTFAIPGALKAIGQIKEINIAVGIITMLSIPVSYIFFKIGMPPYFIYLVTIGTNIMLGANKLYHGNKIAGINIADYINRVIVKSMFPMIISTIISILPLLFFDYEISRIVITFLVSVTTTLILVRYFGITNAEYLQIRIVLQDSWSSIVNKFNKRKDT